MSPLCYVTATGHHGRNSQTFSACDPKEKLGVSSGPKLKKTHHALTKIKAAFGNKITFCNLLEKNIRNHEFKIYMELI